MARQELILKAVLISHRIRAVMELRGVDEKSLSKASGIACSALRARIDECRYVGKGMLEKLVKPLGVTREWLETGEGGTALLKELNRRITAKAQSGKQSNARCKPPIEAKFFAYMKWRSIFVQRWITFTHHQSDPCDRIVADVAKEWPPIHRSRVRLDPMDFLTLDQVSELSKALRIPVSESTIQFGMQQASNAQDSYFIKVFGDKSGEVQSIDPSSVYDESGSIDMLKKSIDLLAQRRSKNATWKECDRVKVRDMLGNIASSGTMQSLNGIQGLPSSAFSICMDALMGERDRKIAKQDPWREIGNAITSLFDLRIVGDPATPFMDAVRQHRKLYTGLARRPIPSPFDQNPKWRMRQCYLMYAGRIVHRSAVEEAYAERALDAQLADRDLTEMDRCSVIIQLHAGYVRFIDAPIHRP